MSKIQYRNLAVRDLVKFLSRLANVHRDEKTGNLELSEGLRQLVNALRPHADRSIDDLAVIFQGQTPSGSNKKPATERRATLPSDLGSTTPAIIEEILGDSTYTKDQLVELGVGRFSISRSKLTRLNRGEILETIRAALDHEKSLDVISQEARRGGIIRS